MENTAVSSAAPPVEDGSSYLGEMRVNWRYLAATCLGLGSGYMLTLYLTSIFLPHLLTEFGWSKAQLSAASALVVLSLVCQPIAGRLTDIFGVRKMAMVGVIGCPLVFIGYGSMTGDISQYFVLQVAQMTVMAMTTTSVTYSRLIAQQFTLTRGLSLALAGSTPAAVAALGAPFLTGFVDVHGWRAGYFALACWSAIAGSTAFLLIPKGQANTRPPAVAAGNSVKEYRTVVRSPAFLIIIVGMALCNLPFIVQSSQMGVILTERGMSSEAVGFLVSLFAFGVIGGRILCGLALDRFATHIVVAALMTLPAIGFFILASGIQVTFLIAIAVGLIGLSMGADMDIMPFVVMRYFRVEIYSTVIGLIGSAVSSAAAIGSLLLSAMLKYNGGDFSAFLALCTFTSFIGGISFLLLGRPGIRDTRT